MDNSSDINVLLGTIKRPLNPIFNHWLSPAQMRLTKTSQILAYLKATEELKIIDKLPAKTKLLLKILIEFDGELTVSALLSRAIAEQYQISLSEIGALHYYGLAFYQDKDLWPKKNREWQACNGYNHLLLGGVWNKSRIDAGPRDKLSLKLIKNSDPDQYTSTLTAQLNQFLALAGEGKLKLKQSQGFSNRAIRRLKDNNLEDGPGVTSIEEFLAFALKIKILKIDSNGQIVPLKSFAKFRQKSPQEELKYYLKYYIENKFLAAAETVPENLEYIILKLVCHILQNVRNENWIDIDQIVKIIETNLNFIYQGTSEAWNWLPPALSESYFDLEFIRQTTMDLLQNWFKVAGIINYGQNGKLVQLSSFGDYFLLSTEAPKHDDEHQKLIIQPDFTALLTHSGPWDAVARTISFFGKRSGDDNASLFHFSQESIHAAIEHGHKIDQLLELFEENSSYPIPPNIFQTFQEWGKVVSDGKIHRDVNLFAFDSRDQRDEFFDSNSEIKMQKIGQLYVVTDESEEKVFALMNLIHAVPIDYTQLPVDGIDINYDGEVECLAHDDIRVTSLRDLIAKKIGDKYYLSLDVINQQKDKNLIYDRIQKLPGRKINLNLALNLLVYFGLLEDKPNYYYIDDFSKIKQKTKAFKWRHVIAAKASPNIVVIKREALEEVIEQLNTIDFNSSLKTYNLRKIPINECQ